MANKIVVDVKTGEQTVVPLTPEEEADALARSAAEEAIEAPKRDERAAIKQLHIDAKATAMYAAIQTATLTQIDNWIDTNFPALNAQQRALLKVLTAAAGAYLRERNEA